MKSITRILLLAMLPAMPLASMAMTTQCGPDVCYQYDETQTAIAVLGLPTLVGNDIRFVPWEFYAFSTDGSSAPGNSASTTFTFDRIYTLSGLDILSVQVWEEGDFQIIGNGAVSALLGLTVSSNVLATDTLYDSAMFSASGGSTGPHLWANTVSASPVGIFAGPGNDLSVEIANLLTADTAGAGDFAFIQKKFVLQTLTAVPVPAAAWLLGSGLGLLGLLRRRARRC